ncbi:hypothetical protein F0U44_06175 [Nocardioides humilatus]|uniref:DUF4386 domain-containing protein n=1 Tax=Nocardioides humilatus TaxID=2607660 RepID=A0A5B1LME8_9ACTN|nr:hypothetical protein [Nocardioides humilatus]KAA1421852.1 hypothetical protein F0U44_06175 [Nocardioides humilatus]
MSNTKTLFSERSQRLILWWGIGLAVIYGVCLIFLFDMVPPPSAEWSPEQVAAFYQEHGTRIRWGSVICGWTSAFMMPILAVVTMQMARVETGGAKIWSALSLVSGAMMSLFLALPPIFWGVAAFNADRGDEITAMMHELGLLTLTTTDQYYIFMWVGVTVLALRPATQLVKHNPFPRWWGYLSLWITVMFEAGAFAFIPKTGPLSWNGLLVFWSPLSLFGVWITIQSWLVFRALRGQVADKQAATEAETAAELEAVLL